MSEPKVQATEIESVRPDLLHWWVEDDRTGGRSDSWAVVHDGRTVLIDPLPLTEVALEQLERFGQVVAICLTASSHQRAAWRYRHRFGVKVYAPENAAGLDEVPDVDYAEGVALPAELVPVHAPGPAAAHFVLHLEREEGALFCADLLVNTGDGLSFHAPEHLDDPKLSRTTARRLLDLKFGVLCPGHGPPLAGRPKEAIRRALGATD